MLKARKILNQFNKSEFKDFLDKKVGLSASTSRLYTDVVNQYFKEYNELTPDLLTMFVVKNTTKNIRRHYVRYAMARYMAMQRVMELEMWKGFKLEKFTRQPNKKAGTYIPVDVIYARIINKLKPLYKTFGELQLMTGARAFEIISLRAENVLFDFNKVQLRLIGKGAKVRHIAVTDEVSALLNPYLKPNLHGYLFLSSDIEDLSKEEQWHMVDKMRSKYNYNITQVRGELKFSTHDFRRNFAQLLKQNGSEIFKISKILGHASLETTQRYFDASDETIQSDITNLQHKIFKPKEQTKGETNESGNKLSEQGSEVQQVVDERAELAQAQHSPQTEESREEVIISKPN